MNQYLIQLTPFSYRNQFRLEGQLVACVQQHETPFPLHVHKLCHNYSVKLTQEKKKSLLVFSLVLQTIQSLH